MNIYRLKLLLVFLRHTFTLGLSLKVFIPAAVIGAAGGYLDTRQIGSVVMGIWMCVLLAGLTVIAFKLMAMIHASEQVIAAKPIVRERQPTIRW